MLTDIDTQVSKAGGGGGDFLYLSLAGFEHTFVTRALLEELLGYELPLERFFLEGDTAVLEIKDTREYRDTIEGLVG